MDEENLTVTVEPGVLLMELSAYVEDHDFFYPPDPGEKSATIGGNISEAAVEIIMQPHIIQSAGGGGGGNDRGWRDDDKEKKNNKPYSRRR